jgi:hypothetical protein
MTDSPPQLDYAPQPAWHRRKSAHRIILAAVLLLGLLASLKWAAPAWNHARLLYYQRRCLSHLDPSNKILYDSKAPPASANLSDWQNFYALFSPPGGRSGVMLFVHELRHKDGTPRLVAIEASNHPQTIPAEFNAATQTFEYTTIQPAGLFKYAKLSFNDSWKSTLKLQDGAPLQINAGQPDPADPSHFTLQYHYANRRGIIDGWLNEDDTILLEPRGPLLSNNN